MSHRLPNLARKVRPKLKPRLAITIYCEGRNTEPQYFRDFARANGNPLVSLEIGQERGVPLTLVRAAASDKKRRRRERRNSFEAADEIWVVFDRDEHPAIPAAMEEARLSGVKIAYSNPCFEVWPILHFRDLDAPLHRHQAQKILQEFCSSYNAASNKVVALGDISDGYKDACRRAEAMNSRREDEGGLRGNPYTDVYMLTEKIRQDPKKWNV